MSLSKVTIGIPTLNRARYLQLALESALRQTHANLEIVVSNNASTDATATLLATCTDPRVKQLQQATRLSMVDNWNACLHAATGEYFLLLSDDDLLEPQAIEKMVAAYESSPDSTADRIGMVYAGGRVIDADGKLVRAGQPAPAEETAPDLVLELLAGRRDAWPCSILLRRSDMGAGYSSSFLVITDAAMWVQTVARHGVARYVNEELVSYRVHQNLTSKMGSSVWQQENRKLVAYAIDCFRAAGIATTRNTRNIVQELSRLNARLAIQMPLDRPNRTSREVLREYIRQLPQLRSAYGMRQLFRGLLILCIPRGMKSLMRRARSAS
jgi:glycosyltransferase involved in cell wall biosynthesis